MISAQQQQHCPYNKQGGYSPLCCIAGGAAGAAVGDGVTKFSICGVWPAANAPGPEGVKPSSALRGHTTTQQNTIHFNRLRSKFDVPWRRSFAVSERALDAWRLHSLHRTTAGRLSMNQDLSTTIRN
jgi:hypothetical protein